MAAFAVLALPFFLFYLGACFSIYHIPRLANPAEFLLLLVPFLPATIFLGCILGRLLPRKELVIFVVLISSLPLVFTDHSPAPSNTQAAAQVLGQGGHSVGNLVTAVGPDLKENQLTLRSHEILI